MKLFLFALMTTGFLLVGCESYHRQDDSSAIQEQQERQEERADDWTGTPEAVETKGFAEKGGNAGNK